MPGAPFCLSGFSKVQESHAYSVLCVHLYALFPHFPQHFQSIDQFITFEQQRLNFWTFFFFYIRQVLGRRGFIHALTESRNSVWTHSGKSEPRKENSATNIPSKEPDDRCICQGTRDPITYNSKPSSTWIFWSWARHKAQSKLYLHLGYFFSCCSQ